MQPACSTPSTIQKRCAWLAALHLVFYLTLALMLGTIFGSRGPVVGIPIVLLVGQQIVFDLLPQWVIMRMPGVLPRFASLIAIGEPIPTFDAVIVTALLSVVFMLVALWRFNREEF